MSAAVYALASVAGLSVMLYPLWRSHLGTGDTAAPGAGAPLVLALLVAFCFAVLALEASSGGLGARTVAALGVLVAINSLLRLVEVAVPGPGGFTPVFFLVVLSGYVFGSRFGFLMGALTMAVSAVVTGGVGPWMPYQMLAAGWVGLTAGWLPGGGRERAQPSRREVAALAVFGGLWGFGYGLLMTPWTWGYFNMGDPGQASVTRFLSFYVATSFAWDVFAAGGTALLVWVAGAPVLGALRRMGRWFDFQQTECPPPGTEARLEHGTEARLEHGAFGAMARPTPDTALPLDPDAAGAAALRRTGLIHPYAWVAWAAGIVALSSATRNPIVLIMAVLAVGVVAAAVPRSGLSDVGVSIGKTALLVIPLATLYNVLSAHYGNTVLLRLPAQLPLVGGALTLESLVYGVAVGLSLVLLIASFTIVARVVPARTLTRLVPRAFGALSLTASIALSYLPSARKQLLEIREAQAVRGQKTRGARSWLPLVLPLLIGGLERSVTLAESLTARGLAPSSRPVPTMLRLAMPVGIAVVLVGWIGAVTGTVTRLPIVLLVTTGVVVAVGALLRLGRRARFTTFRRDPFSATDAVVAASAWAPLVVAWLSASGREVLDYSPVPQVHAPEMDAVLALALLGLAVPAVVVGAGRRVGVAPRRTGGREVGRLEKARRAPRGAGGRGVGRFEEVGRTRRRPVAPAAVRFQAFGYTYPGTGNPVLSDVTFDASPGALTLVTGDSGSGKSTLLRAVNGLVPHFTGGQLTGAVRVAGYDPVSLGPGAMGDIVGFVSGDPERTFVMDTVADEVAFALENRGLGRAEMAGRIDWALHQVAMDGFGDRAIDTLSGGERQRIAVAAALATVPRVLVLDEPTSQVDDDTARGMVQAIRALTRDREVTVLVSEHRLDRLLGDASVTLTLRGAAPPIVRGAGELALTLGSALPVSAPPAHGLGGAVLYADGLSFSYRGREVLRDVSLTVRQGEVVALMGASGSGKTTLLRLCVGLLAPDAGRVLVLGHSIAGREVFDICRDVGYVPQDPNALLFADTVLDELRHTLANHGRHDPADDLASQVLDDLGIADLASRYPRDLSTGQRQRSALAAIAVTRPSVLLLDEPTRGLDGTAIADLARTLHALAAAGSGVLIATHDRRLAAAAHRVLHLGNGAVSEHAPAEICNRQLTEPPPHGSRESYNTRASCPQGGGCGPLNG